MESNSYHNGFFDTYFNNLVVQYENFYNFRVSIKYFGIWYDISSSVYFE